jgi:hypothetical protein
MTIKLCISEMRAYEHEEVANISQNICLDLLHAINLSSFSLQLEVTFFA